MDAASGERFLIVSAIADPDPAPLNVVLNWHEELRARVPVN